MKNRIPKSMPYENREKINASRSIEKKKMKKNLMRLGGGGLSLEAFANAKTKSNHYNPALIKKQREFYKNAKYVGKYKKSLKQQNQQNNPYPVTRPLEDGNETEKARGMNKNKKNNRKSAQSLQQLYEKQREEEEKARIEREAIMQAKKEERERSESRRKASREKMLKKTKSGQPIMKYRIEHLLETIQASTN
ncbi:RRNA-processing protein like [Actinidia chinensis var. chinensis]|uniref:rRNA-processing protein like n=1 Tax=Actinidia chinensis var. chinensis TaxID=1590841 RepID=A0A2R6PNY5_ACTCC|nr:RRNA-processing protein like [Actinidia chinensis var. chinensis]